MSDTPTDQDLKPGDEHWYSPVEAAHNIDADGEPAWDLETDLVVVGFGAAGAAAALEAREGGLQVLALDRHAGGGATKMSGGVFYAGGGTAVQRECGEDDDPDNMYRYLKLEVGDAVSDETLRRFCDNSAATVDWLMGHGVKFSGPVWKKKTSYPNPKYFLYHSDNTLLPANAEVARPAARGHRGVTEVTRSAVNLGGAIFDPMRESALRLGVQLHVDSEVRQLVVNSEGRVIGVKALQFLPGSDAEARHRKLLNRATRVSRAWPAFLPGGRRVRKMAKRWAAQARELEENERVTRYFRARRGVVLSAGGFIFNRPMVRHYLPDYAAGMPMGTPADDGSGIRLGQSAGGAVKFMDRGTAWRFINPPLAWSQGVVVNARGERFVNESAYGATLGKAMVDGQDGRAWMIIDGTLLREAWRQIGPGKVLPFQRYLAALNMIFARKRVKSIDELVAHFGFDSAAIANSLAEYNRAAAGEIPDPQGKAPADTRGLQPPYHVIDISLGARLLPCTVMSVGGLDLDEATGQVRSRDGGVVPGLYAAGRTAVGIPSNLYMSGLSIADGVFAGRRAGRYASEYP